MRYTDINTIFTWFEEGDFPSEKQFQATFSSFYHKSENIPIGKIEGLNDVFGKYVLSDTFNSHLKDDRAHEKYLVKLDASNITEDYRPILRNALGVGDLPTNIATTDYVDENAKNVGNAPIVSDVNGSFTQGANWSHDTAGFSYDLKGLFDKSNDNTFTRMRVQNSRGNEAFSNGTNQIIHAMNEASDAQKTAWRLASRKSDETYSVGQPRIDAVILPFVDSSKTFIQYISLIGLNLFVDNATPNATLRMKRVKDVDGSLLANPEFYDIENYSVFQNSPTILNFGLKFNEYPEGFYQFFCTHNGLINPTSPELYVKNGILFNNIDGSTIKWYNQSDGSEVTTVSSDGTLTLGGSSSKNVYSQNIITTTNMASSNGFVIKCSVNSTRRSYGAAFYKGGSVNISGGDNIVLGAGIPQNYGSEIVYFAYYNGVLSIIEETKGKTKLVSVASMTSMDRFIRYIDKGGGTGSVSIKVTQYLLFN